jgi:hypothetical protein
MKVKVTKTIDFSNVPEFTSEIIAECKTRLDSVSLGLNGSMLDIESFMQSTEKAQEQLSLVAELLQDASNIAVGWHQAQSQPVVEEEQSEEN